MKITPDLPSELTALDRPNSDGRERLGLDELARIAYFRPDTLSPGFQAELVVTRHYVPRAWPFAFTNGIQASHVDVDVETGEVALLKHWRLEDCGTVIKTRSSSTSRCAAAWYRGWGRPCMRDASTMRTAAGSS
jgi:carbon-monoxide dehydrogenase large subunit